MKKKCMIVDDESVARNILRKYIHDTPNLELVSECKNALEALEHVQKQTIDIIFLDIEMPKLSGLNFAKIVDKNKNVLAACLKPFYRCPDNRHI